MRCLFRKTPGWPHLIHVGLQISDARRWNWLEWAGQGEIRHTWERNLVNNWSNDPLAPYSPIVSTQGIWLASENPNYNVHLITASLSYTW